jgi:hypothetical protein
MLGGVVLAKVSTSLQIPLPIIRSGCATCRTLSLHQRGTKALQIVVQELTFLMQLRCIILHGAMLCYMALYVSSIVT